MSDLRPHFAARIFRMKLGHLAEQFAGLFVPRLRRFNGNFYNLIPTLIGALAEHSLFAQTEALAILGALLNFEQRAPVDGGHFDLGAESRFPDRDRHFDFDVVALALEERMLLYFGVDVEIARRGALRAGVPLAGD